MGLRSNLPTSRAVLAERNRCIDIIRRRGDEIGGAIQPERTIKAILDGTVGIRHNRGTETI